MGGVVVKERVTVRQGSVPVLLVAPHGHHLDDTNTAELALEVARQLDAFAVVNNDWKRGVTVDALTSVANCNNRDHCQDSVVYEEFYAPVLEAVDAIQAIESEGAGQSEPHPLVLMLHGVGNRVRVDAGDPDLSVIIGYGRGTPDRLTCDSGVMDTFAHHLSQSSLGIYFGRPGGNYSAHSKKNLTQDVHGKTGCSVLQLEFVTDVRDPLAKCHETADVLAAVLTNTVTSIASGTSITWTKSSQEI